LERLCANLLHFDDDLRQPVYIPRPGVIQSATSFSHREPNLMPTPEFARNCLFIDTRIRDRDQAVFPNLMRLHLDFGFRIVQQMNVQTLSNTYFLSAACTCADTAAPVTPPQPSLRALDTYARINMTDLLYNCLFDNNAELSAQR
jgi:hypothetical protein